MGTFFSFGDTILLIITSFMKGSYMFENIGGVELIIILTVVLLLFGPKKIPELAQGIGKGIREFKKGLNDVQDQIKNIDK
jgi:sec-independent protein translocase protein TatA